MANKKFTLLELHLNDGAVRVGSTTLGGDDEDADASADTETDDDGGCTACKVGKLLLLVGVLAAVAVGVRKLRGGEDLDELEELEDLE